MRRAVYLDGRLVLLVAANRSAPLKPLEFACSYERLQPLGSRSNRVKTVRFMAYELHSVR